MQRWLLMSNCQTFGLVNSMRLLCSDIEVEALDPTLYTRRLHEINDSFGDYDRVIVSHEIETVPGADFSKARMLDRLPALSFAAYHPDLTYLVVDGRTLLGPLDSYHSMIAFVAHGKGRSVAETIELYNEKTFAACGYLDRWLVERDRTIADFAEHGLDVSFAIRRWGRSDAFMYSSNHPKIRCLHDIARLYLRRAGFEANLSGNLPPDNLATGPCFPIYPEIAESLGVQGSYRFKRLSDYREIDLPQFIAESFSALDRHAHETIEIPGVLRPLHDQLVTLM